MRAVELRKQLCEVDFTIDLHSSAANVGLVLMISAGDYDPLATRIAYYLKSIYPEMGLRVTFSKGLKRDSWSADSISTSGISIEVGPLTHNSLQMQLMTKTRKLINGCLDYIDARNKILLALEPMKWPGHETVEIDKLDTNKNTYKSNVIWYLHDSKNDLCHTMEVFQMLQYVKFPLPVSLTPDDTETIANIRYHVHPYLDGRDWEELKDGNPLFLSSHFDCVSSVQDIIYFDKSKHLDNAEDRNKSVFILFVNEPAYIEEGIAFALYEKVTKTVY
jgi:aspartoacylase